MTTVRDQPVTCKLPSACFPPLIPPMYHVPLYLPRVPPPVAHRTCLVAESQSNSIQKASFSPQSRALPAPLGLSPFIPCLIRILMQC